ncbi:MAG TPA: hypothetical protein VJ999_03925 [Candidatus Sulfotelmatobacter sp.]|nr:hypothetical protein [Candidatus Sulfotelmatobacter sp.]
MWWTLFTAVDLYIGVIVLDAMAPSLPPEKRARVRAARKVILGLLAGFGDRIGGADRAALGMDEVLTGYWFSTGTLLSFSSSDTFLSIDPYFSMLFRSFRC